MSSSPEPDLTCGFYMFCIKGDTDIQRQPGFGFELKTAGNAQDDQEYILQVKLAGSAGEFSLNCINQSDMAPINEKLDADEILFYGHLANLTKPGLDNPKDEIIRFFTQDARPHAEIIASEQWLCETVRKLMDHGRTMSLSWRKRSARRRKEIRKIRWNCRGNLR